MIRQINEKLRVKITKNNTEKGLKYNFVLQEKWLFFWIDSNFYGSDLELKIEYYWGHNWREEKGLIPMTLEYSSGTKLEIWTPEQFDLEKSIQGFIDNALNKINVAQKIQNKFA